MTAAQDVSPREEVQQVNKAPVDVLGRQEFVNQLISVAETLAANKKNACYALNGEWGVGKSFVLEAFEKQIAAYQQDGPETNKYLVFHYDCWQYDYYDEPLIAIVAVILDQIDKQARLIPEEKREKIKAALKIIGASLWGKTKDLIKEKTGFDIALITDLFQSTKDTAEEKIAETHKFDAYFDFKNVLLQLTELINSIAKEQTVIFIVDELDRCLPEYTVKVLERLHHVFNDIKNIQVILAVDKDQLANTIRQIYGEKISVNHYLEKFIDFELKLDAGNIVDIVGQLFPQYLCTFKVEDTTEEEVEKVCQTLLNGIEIRKAKSIVEKSYLCHRLLTPEEELQDRVVLCIEIFLVILNIYGLKIEEAKNSFEIEEVFQNRFFTAFDVQGTGDEIIRIPGFRMINEMYKEGVGQETFFSTDRNGTEYIKTINVYGVLLGCYRALIGYTNDYWLERTNYSYFNSSHFPQEYLTNYTLKFWKFLQKIK